MQVGSLEAKQQYLRQKIIDAGHDPEQFVEFCSSTHNLQDLENWSLHELVEIVQAFLRHIDPQSHKKQHPAHQDPPPLQNGNNVAVGQGKKVDAGGGKMGLVLTEDDWSILLSAPSVVASKTDQKQQNNHQSQLFSMDFSFPLIDPLGQKAEPVSKDSPLSPPSTMQKQTISTPVIAQPHQNEQNEVSLRQHVRMDKKGEKRGSESSAINLSNIIITTAKEKPLQPLPNIQDVTVSKTEQVARNFLQGDYTLYHITLSPCQHTIQRKFSDFTKMRAVLRRLYPFLRLPHLEAQGWLGSSQGKDPETLSRYKGMVEQFMRFMLLRSEELRQCEAVRFFCGLTKKEYSKEEFRKKLEAYEAIPRPKFVGEVVLTNNTIAIPPTAPADKFCLATSSLVAEIDAQYERLRRQLEVLFSNYELLVKSYSDIGSTLATVQSLLSRHLSDHHEGKQFGAFASLQGMVTRLTNKLVQEAETFRGRIRTLFRYERDNMATLREVIDHSSSIHHQFNRQGSPPLSAHRVRAGSMEIDSPVPLEDPVRNNKGVLSVQEIFWSFAVRREAGRYWELLRRKINESLTLIAYDQLDAQNENLNFWNGIIKRCVL